MLSNIKVVETGEYAIQYGGLGYVFHSIPKFHADLGTGLYTEGTGNLYNVKAATNPVEVVFRKHQQDIDPASGQDHIKMRTVLLEKFNGLLKQQGLDGLAVATRVEDKNVTANTPITDSTIYEWLAAVNGGSYDRQTFTVFGVVDTYSPNGANDLPTQVKRTEVMPLFTLNGAILIDADIRRNPHRGVTFSELKFVADSVTGVVTTTSLTQMDAANQKLLSAIRDANALIDANELAKQTFTKLLADYQAKNTDFNNKKIAYSSLADADKPDKYKELEGLYKTLVAQKKALDELQPQLQEPEKTTPINGVPDMPAE